MSRLLCLSFLAVHPAGGDVWVEAQEQMQVIVHHGEAADGYSEDFCKFFESPIDPFFAVGQTFPEEERASHSEPRSDTSGSGQRRRDARVQSSWMFSGGQFADGQSNQCEMSRLLCLSFLANPSEILLQTIEVAGRITCLIPSPIDVRSAGARHRSSHSGQPEITFWP